jgi:hypothetical protein
MKFLPMDPAYHRFYVRHLVVVLMWGPHDLQRKQERGKAVPDGSFLSSTCQEADLFSLMVMLLDPRMLNTCVVS